MAGIEKICEYSGEYPGWKMYEYKKNHIQIMPRYRKLFAGKDHTLYIFKPTLHKFNKKHGWTECLNGGFEDDWHRYYDEPFNMEEYKQLISWLGYRIITRYEYVLHVPNLPGNVNGMYMNRTSELGTTKRKLKRLMNTSELNTININSRYAEWLKNN